MPIAGPERYLQSTIVIPDEESHRPDKVRASWSIPERSTIFQSLPRRLNHLHAGSMTYEQGSGVRGQGSGVRSQKSEVRSQWSEVRRQWSEVRRQGSEVRGQKSEVRGLRSKVRGLKQRSEV